MGMVNLNHHIDVATAQHFRLLIDPTTFATIKRWVLHSESDIEHAILLHRDYALEELATLLSACKAVDLATELRRMIRTGVIGIAVPRNRPEGFGWSPWCVDMDGISDEEPCRVICLPPSYLVQLSRPESNFPCMGTFSGAVDSA